MLTGKRVLLCVTGGIAAYRAAELVRLMMKEGADVRVAMTAASTKFVTPLTFQALCGLPVMVDIFDQQEEAQIGHIGVARWADCVVVAPATGNFIGKVANGIADDIVTTVIMATRKPIVVAPAMNWAMWQNEMVQANVERLSAMDRFSFVMPEEGDLACGETGRGRLAGLNNILDAAVYACHSEQDLSGEMVLVTAGPTYEDIDPVRYIANRSSGKMGFAIAREARARGAQVVLVSGPTDIEPPYGVNLVTVRSAQQMLEAVRSHAGEANIIIKAAAVADYRPARASDKKIHKTDGEFNLAMSRTVDILRELGQKKKRDQFLVGFAAETHQVMTNGREKLRKKNLDLIVINDVSTEGAGFEVDTNVVKVIDTKGHIESWPLLAKSKVAKKLFDLIQEQRASQKRNVRGTRPRGRGSASRSRKPRQNRTPKPRAAASQAGKADDKKVGSSETKTSKPSGETEK